MVMSSLNEQDNKFIKFIANLFKLMVSKPPNFISNLNCSFHW